MKRVVLYDVNNRIPNLALMKISSFYKKAGYKRVLSKEIEYIKGDIYFASSVFYNEKSNILVDLLRDIYGDDISLGGSGIDLKKTLPVEIDGEFPDYDLYKHKEYAIGFLTRGCNKQCQFCLVPQKEGKLRNNYSSFDDFVPKKQKNVMLLDNDLLAADNSFQLLEEMISRRLNVNFSQSLDIARLDHASFGLLTQINSVNSRFSKPMYYFSCNSSKQLKAFYKKEKYLRGFGKDRVTVIVMFGFNTRLSEDYEILAGIKSLGLIPFVQEYAPIIGNSPTQINDYFDMDLDIIANMRFRTNGVNGEKFLRYVNKLYFNKFGNYYLPILENIYRYNNKEVIHKYLVKPHLISQKQYEYNCRSL